MRHIFLTACRNESRIVDQFLEEFAATLQGIGILADSVLYVIDDLSVDGSPEQIERACPPLGIDVRVVRAPTNLGNQGAMFLGLQHLEVAPDGGCGSATRHGIA